MTPAERAAVEAAIRERDKASKDVRLRGWRKDFADVGTVQVVGDGSGESIDHWMRSAIYAHNDRRDLLALLDAERVRVAELEKRLQQANLAGFADGIRALAKEPPR